ncbi:protein LCHN-like [Scleropages formosus]|uniref:DENN domain-containing protein 11 n=2 Tax=Scleropages formosus TaxID=113540 RepID=A0A8C9W2T8_SCLFO|nr:protein LCHN-like [Scleropages formosus]
MVEQSDRAPLLDWEEVPPPPPPPGVASASLPSPRKDLRERILANSRALGHTGPGTGWSSGPEAPAAAVGDVDLQSGGFRDGTEREGEKPGGGGGGTGRLSAWDGQERDQIVAVFVVTFDTRSGNIVEWCLPEDVNLEGVEFKSMASGSHRISNDFIYFRKDRFFGLACFANMPVESELERGARMKSVGILTPSYTLLYRYMHFLENQVRHQLQYPGQYTPLEAFFEDKKAVLPSGGDNLITACPGRALGPTVNRCCVYPEMKITHPAGCMSQFIRFFGERIMVLWKFALLRKRILIFSPPPVGVVCYRVYCCCCLANVSVPGVGVSVPELRPFFYINVADIPVLETELSYVACTTEKIFEEKKELYDVYVDNQNVKTHRESLQPLLRLNSADREKYKKLSEQRQMLVYSQNVNADCSSSEEDLFILFFMEQNNRIFQTLSEVAGSADPTLTADHMKAMGLDPQGDHSFLVDLLEVYGIDAMLVIDNPCCP